MGLFDEPYGAILEFLAQKREEGIVTEQAHGKRTLWPQSRERNLVMGQDTAVELGNPENASTAFLIWVNEPDRLTNGRITVVGPDLPQLAGRQVSFGKIVLVAGDDFDADNSYDRYREMELLRYDIRLKGYMMRGVSQYLREWSRVSREAIGNGFSFAVLGGAIIDRFLELAYVKSVEVIFITAGKPEVLALQPVAESVMKRIWAMNKMAEQLSLDCDTCPYTEVCGGVAELRAMRNRLVQKERAVYV